MENNEFNERAEEKKMLQAESKISANINELKKRKPPKINVQRTVQSMLGVTVLIPEKEVQRALLGKKAFKNLAEEFKTGLVQMTTFEKLVLKAIEKANDGSINHLQWLADRAFGKLENKIEANINVNHARYIPNEELEEYLIKLEKEAAAENIDFEEL